MWESVKIQIKVFSGSKMKKMETYMKNEEKIGGRQTL
jgi:hypothetical protein